MNDQQNQQELIYEWERSLSVLPFQTWLSQREAAQLKNELETVKAERDTLAAALKESRQGWEQARKSASRENEIVERLLRALGPIAQARATMLYQEISAEVDAENAAPAEAPETPAP